ncbi:glycosyltransferase family 2 protein [Neisseriaceae bacterium TC5R-5]|nr:glycosyltransferase family 2 protein [Neisseriaceae bacterium TC5R-5]
MESQLKKTSIGADQACFASVDSGSQANLSATTLPSTPLQNSAKVAILLCTYNGQSYLAEQLDSFAAQTYSNWEVWASDDGSQDGTAAILAAYQSQWKAGCLSVHSGPSKGYVPNFLSLTCKASIEADYYAYSDQDDIWETDKLERAVNWLQTVPKDIPALYCSRTRLVDVDNKPIGYSPLFAKPPSFANALIQSIAGGNTMVFNNAARKLLQKAGENISVVAHDWWAYIVITGCDGQVFYDPYPSLRYRQHDNNLVGMNSTWGARCKRLYKLHQGHFRSWNSDNIAALRILQDNLTPQNREAFEQFAKSRHLGLVQRLIGFKVSGVYRQTVLGNLGLIAAALFKKI